MRDTGFSNGKFEEQTMKKRIMSTVEAMENFKYIDRCHDLGIFNEDEDEN